MTDKAEDPRVERIARELAHWHGSAYSHQNHEREMQTVASSYAGHRWAHASDEYARAKWQQYRGAARHAMAMVDAEREACALKAREYAAHYQEGSDGRNTFILLAEWIEARATAQST